MRLKLCVAVKVPAELIDPYPRLNECSDSGRNRARLYQQLAAQLRDPARVLSDVVGTNVVERFLLDV
jgi:hypothetical protein